MDLEVQIKEEKSGAFTVIPKGRMDTETYLIFEKEVQPLIQKKARHVLVDMAGVNYISSAGLNAIFHLRKKVQENRGELALSNLQPHIRKVFEIIKALPNTNIFASVDEADEYLARIMEREINKEPQADD